MKTNKKLSEVLAKELTAESIHKLCSLYDLITSNKEQNPYTHLVEAIFKDDIIKQIFNSAGIQAYHNTSFIPANHSDSSEVVKALNISKRTLVEWRKAGILPYIIFRNKCFYKNTDLVKLLEINYSGGDGVDDSHNL